MVQAHDVSAPSLEAMLSAATVAIEGVADRGATAVGTGFFAAPDLVVTCAHVVQASPFVVGEWLGRRIELDVVRALHHDNGAGPDLALLRPREAGLQPTAPWACLNEAYEIDDELWAWGYPRTAYRAGDALTFRAVGSSRHRGGAALVKVTGVQVFGGHSGSPVLNRRTGGVVGVLRGKEPRSADSDAHHAARLVPVSSLLNAFPEVTAAQRTVTSSNSAWLDLLTDAQIRNGRWRHPGPLLRRYLRAAVDAADEHPYATLWERLTEDTSGVPPLTRVYLRQKVGQVPRQRPVRTAVPAPLALSAGHPSEPRPPGFGDRLVGPAFDDHTAPRLDTESAESLPLGPQPAEDALAQIRHALVLGGPGSGKSSLLRHLTRRAGEAWLAGRYAAHVPVRVSAEALAEGATFCAALARAVVQQLRPWDELNLPEELFEGYPLERVPWLVLVDGVDEILDQKKRREVLRILAERGGQDQYRIIVASRFLPTGELDVLQRASYLDMETFEIQPFHPDELAGFAASWFRALGTPTPDELAERFIEDLRSRRLENLTRIPLLATMLCSVYARTPGHELPTRRASLYESFVGLLSSKQYDSTDIYRQLPMRLHRYAGPAGAQAAENLVSQQRVLLELLAESDRCSGWTGLVDTAVAATAALCPSHLDAHQWRQALLELLRQSGLFTEFRSDGSSGIRFVHRTLQEYLAACHLAARVQPLSPEGQALIDQGNDPDAESFILFLLSCWRRSGQDVGTALEQALDRDGAMAAGLVLAAERDAGPLDADLVGRAARLMSDMATATDGHLRMEDRLWAVRRLADHDAPSSVRILIGLIRSGRLSDALLTQALLTVGELDQDEAVGVSRFLLNGRGLSRAVRIWIVMQLTTLDSEQAWEVLEDLTTTRRTDRAMRAWAAGRLASVDAVRGERALTAMLSDHTVSGGTRLWLAELLSTRHRSLAAWAFGELAADSSVEPRTRVLAARHLAERAPDRARALLTAIAVDPALLGSARRSAATALRALDRRAGEQAFRSLACDEAVPMADRIAAAESLAFDDLPAAAAALRSMAGTSGARTWEVRAARDALARVQGQRAKGSCP